MALDQASIVAFFREQNPEYYEDWTDDDIYRSTVSELPEIQEHFEYTPRGISELKAFGPDAGFWTSKRTLSHAERVAAWFPATGQRLAYGLEGLVMRDPEGAERKQQLADEMHEQVIKNNPRLLADLEWKSTEHGWSSFDATARAFSEAVPSLAISVASIAAGMTASKIPGLTPLSRKLVQYGVSAFPMFTVETSSHYSQSMRTFIDEYGMTPEEAQDYSDVSSVAYGIASTAWELLGARHAIGVASAVTRKNLLGVGEDMLSKNIMRKLVDKGVNRSFLAKTGFRAGAGGVGLLSLAMAEGSTESLQALTGLTIQSAMEQGARNDPPAILKRFTQAVQDAWNDPSWMEEGYAGFTTGIFGFGAGIATMTSVEKQRVETIKKAYEEAQKEILRGEDIIDETGATGELFGVFLDSVLDPKRGGEAQDLAAETPENDLSKRIKKTVEFTDAGHKILEAVGTEEDLVSEIQKHKSSKVLLEEVRKVFNTQRPEDAQIKKGDKKAIVAMLNTYAKYGRIVTPDTREGGTLGEGTGVEQQIQWGEPGTTPAEEEAQGIEQTRVEDQQIDDEREEGKGPGGQQGLTYQEQVARGLIKDPAVEKALLKQIKEKDQGSGLPVVAGLEAIKVALKKQYDALPKKGAEKEKRILGVQISSIDSQLALAKRSESVETSAETADPTTIQKGDTVTIGGKGRHSGKVGTVVEETKPGEKGSWRIKIAGTKGIATIAKSVVSKPEIETTPIAPPSVESPKGFVVHSGGALNFKRDNVRDSADTVWEDQLAEKGVTTVSHSFPKHKQGGKNKLVHSKDELKAADDHIDIANDTLKRKGKGWTTELDGYVRNLFRRSWYQVKDASQVLAIGNIVTVKGVEQVDGGTGATVQMAIDNNKPVFVFDENTNLWKTWDGNTFVETDTPTLLQNSATIGTRNIGPAGKMAIQDVIDKTFVGKPTVKQTAPITAPVVTPKTQTDITKLENEYNALQKKRKEIAANPKGKLGPIDKQIAKVAAQLKQAGAGTFVDPDTSKDILDDTDIPPFSKDLGLTNKEYKSIIESLAYVTQREQEQVEKEDFSGAETSREQINVLRGRLGLEKIAGTPTQTDIQNEAHSILQDYVSTLSPLEQTEYEEDPIAFLEREIDKGSTDVIPILKAITAYKTLNETPVTKDTTQAQLKAKLDKEMEVEREIAELKRTELLTGLNKKDQARLDDLEGKTAPAKQPDYNLKPSEPAGPGEMTLSDEYAEAVQDGRMSPQEAMQGLPIPPKKSETGVEKTPEREKIEAQEKDLAAKEQARLETETLKIDKELEDHAKKRGYRDWIQVLTDNGYTPTAEKFNSLTKSEITRAAKRSEAAQETLEESEKAASEEEQTELDDYQKNIDNPKNYDEDQKKFQRLGQSKEILAGKDKALRDKLLKRLKKHFPFVDVKTFDGLIKIHGMEIVGFATEKIVAWSTTDATLDTLPHEYAHIYVKMLKHEPIIKLGIKKYGTEEALVQAIGEYYTNRMRTKGAINKIKIWLKQFVNRLKRIFGVQPKDKKEIMEFIAEEFFQGRWLGINVEVGGGWIDFQSRTTDDLANLGNLMNASGETGGSDGMTGEETDANLRNYPSDLRITDMYSKVLGIYLNKTEDYPKILEIADKSKSFEEFRDNLFNWAKQLTDKRQRRGDDKLKNKDQLTEVDIGNLHEDWIKANRRIRTWFKGDIGTQGDDTRIYQHLIHGPVKNSPQGLETRGKRDLAQDKDHASTNTRNFVEQDIIDGVHSSRPIYLPIKQILAKYERKGGGYWYQKRSYDITTDRLTEIQKDHGQSYVDTISKKISALKTVAVQQLKDGLDEKTVKNDLIQGLIDIGTDESEGSNLLSIIGSKLGDHAAIISTIARETPMTLTPKSFRAILDHALDNKLIRQHHYNIMMKDSNLAGMEKMDKDIINLPWSQYIVNQAADDTQSVNDLINNILGNDLKFLGAMKVKMAQSLAQFRFWQNIRTPDYFMYENSASDSMVRLSINLAEGPNPLGAGKGRLMIVDKNTRVRNTKRDNDNETLEYDLFDGATFSGSGYMNKLAEALGAPKLSQLKTFIRQRTENEETGETDYLGMKHMMFTAYDGMVLEDQNGFEIAKIVTKGIDESGAPITFWESAETGELFDMIASPNEAKMTFGGFASTQQKIDAFGEGDYENGYYKIHEIDEKSIAVTQMAKFSKTSAAHPIAFAEFLLDMGFESQEVQELLSEIRGRYIHVLNHYTNAVKEFHDNPGLLKEYMTKESRDNQIPDELQELLDIIDEDGMGMFHDALYTHILPVLNSRIIQDGINKARSFKDDSTVLYLKPSAHLPIAAMDKATGHKGLMASADNSTAFNYVFSRFMQSQGISEVELVDGQPPSFWQVEVDGEMRYWNKRVSEDGKILETGLKRGQKIDILNKYLEENEVWTLVHRNPLQKVTGPVLRRLHKLVKGAHGQTFMMTAEDVKNILDGDWDGDKGAIEFISDSHKNAMQKWHKSAAHKLVDKILKLEFFGERVDTDEKIADTSVLSREDIHNEVSRNAKSDGSTGVMVNAMVISRQLFHKNFEIAVGGELNYTLRVSDFDQDSSKGIVMDYIPLSVKMLNKNKGELIEIIYNNGDLIVDKDGKEVEVNQVDLGAGVEGETQGALSVASDGEVYLKTTKANELSLLFQMAVDGAKYRFWSEIIDQSGLTPFEFAMSRIFVRSDGHPLSKADLKTVTVAYGVQNTSKQRRGDTDSGLAATWGIALSQSDALLNRINRERSTDKQLTSPNKDGNVKGTYTNEEYTDNFRDEMDTAIEGYYWGFKGHDEFDITMENNITPVESMLMSSGYKLRQSENYNRISHPTIRKKAHIMALEALSEGIYMSGLYNEFMSGRLQDDYKAANSFMHEKMEIPDKGTSVLSDVILDEKKAGTKEVSFAQIWRMLKNHTHDQAAVKADVNEAYAGFIDRFIDKWDSLSEESQAWVTFSMLSGTENTMYNMKILPFKLQNVEVLKRYFRAYGEALNSKDFEMRTDTLKGLSPAVESRVAYTLAAGKGTFRDMQRQVHKKNMGNEQKISGKDEGIC